LDTLIEAKKLQVVSNKPVLLVSEFFMSVSLNWKFCFRGLPCNPGSGLKIEKEIISDSCRVSF